MPRRARYVVLQDDVREAALPPLLLLLTLFEFFISCHYAMLIFSSMLADITPCQPCQRTCLFSFLLISISIIFAAISCLLRSFSLRFLSCAFSPARFSFMLSMQLFSLIIFAFFLRFAADA